MGCGSSSTAAGSASFVAGERVFFCGAGNGVPSSWASSSAEAASVAPPASGGGGRGGSSSSAAARRSLTFGAEGEVVSITSFAGNVVVAFSGCSGPVKLRPQELTKKAPSIPGGFELGERVFYGGPGRRYSNGDQLSFCSEGQVVGRGCIGDGLDDERLAVSFLEHKESKTVRIALLSRQPPTLPGGYKVGDRVFWCGMNWTFQNGDKLKFGSQGEVAGRSCVGDGFDDERLAVTFPGNKGAVAMRLPEISHEMPVIPGGYSIGDKVFYTYPNWRSPDGNVLLFGAQGKVIGRSCIGDGRDEERVWVLFPGLGYGCICLDQISRERPVISGGYTLGDKVFFCGPSRSTGVGGDRVHFGMQGSIAGGAASARPSRRQDVAVIFDGNEEVADVGLAEISRTPPIIPGGYLLGDAVFYHGRDWLCSNGDRLTHGGTGEVAGRSCKGDDQDDDRVAIIMPGNRYAAHIFLSDIGSEPPPNLEDCLWRRLEAALESRPWPQEGPGAAHHPSAGSALEPPSCPGTTAEEGAVPGRKAGDTGVELAVVYRTAIGANIPSIAARAEDAVFAQVTVGRINRDMVLLSQLKRAAEDTEWRELYRRSSIALEDVALPGVLDRARARGDAFGQLAVGRRARVKGLRSLAEVAAASSPASLAISEACADDTHDTTKTQGTSIAYSKADNPELVEQMQLLLDETYTGWGGFGRHTRTRDRPNERVAERLEVESVVQLTNVDSYLNYMVRREVVASELPDGFKRDWNVRTTSGELSPQARMHSPRRAIATCMKKATGGPDDDEATCPTSAPPVVDPDLNEHYLWHGTGPTEAQGIADQGFDIQQAGSARGALFGRGLYFAESCLKADEYVRADERGWFPMILCRVTLGNVNYCDAEDPFELREVLRVSCRGGSEGYHSVLGDREKVRQTFREFVIFDGHQAYPEFIVWYSRK